MDARRGYGSGKHVGIGEVVRLARQGAVLAATGPVGISARLLGTGARRWRAQRALLRADTHARRQSLAQVIGPPRTRRRRWPWAVGALGLVGVAATVVVLVRPTPPPPPAAAPPRVDDPLPPQP